ncbi:MAG: WYL domain-containing transcriptional regulator [Verrucomicrobiales bacterium]|nr:WYL domain-containing transcriptional regulator [Verrucomicrobiales bacterium]
MTSSPERATRPPLERMLRIHQAIQAGGFPNAETLARDLEVSTKSVRRDLEFMRDRLGLPLSYDERRWGYHYTEDVGAFPALQISEGELFALLVAEKAIQQYRGTNFEEPLTSALRKMSAGLPDTVSVHWADWDRTISFRTSAEPILNLEIFDAVARAVADRRSLRIQYRKPGSAASETREIDPWHLANINGEWYLFAHDHLRKAVRTFVPARIQSVEPTGRTFTPPARFSVDRELRDSFGVHSAQGDFDVAIRFSPRTADYIREKRWHASQRLIEHEDGGVELQMRLSSLVEVQRWILGWGGDAVALRPPELVLNISAAARRLLRSQHPNTPKPRNRPPR